MKPIPEELVADVVAEASRRMADADYTAEKVAELVSHQEAIAKYLTARAMDLGGMEGVAGAMFHASLIAGCLERAGAPVPPLGFSDLARVPGGDPVATLAEQEPALAAYIGTNVEDPRAARCLALVALALTAGAGADPEPAAHAG